MSGQFEFEAALAHTLKFEGGYAHDPKDSGGETFRGISRKNWPRWEGWPLIDAAKMNGLKTAKALDGHFQNDGSMAHLVAHFYLINFWNPWLWLGRENSSSKLWAKMFDASVNLGPGGAAKVLQRALNSLGAKLKDDGVVGPKTRAALALALAEGGEEALVERVARKQGDYYRAIVARKPSQARFLTGWLRRAEWRP